MQNAKCKMQSAKCKVQNAKCKMQNANALFGRFDVVCLLNSAFCIVPAASFARGAGGEP
jgi:hypothetical protein